MYLSHKGTFVVAASIFALGLFVVVMLPRNLQRPLTTFSSAQTPGVPGGPGSFLLTPAPVLVLSLTCQMCDLDGSGVIDTADIGIIQQILVRDPANIKAQQYMAFCKPLAIPATPVAACPVLTTAPIPLVTAPGPGPSSAVPTSAIPSGGQPGGGGGNSGLGDCAGIQGAGKNDGITNVLDFEVLRQELNVEVTTTYCDFDKNGGVDIIDFTNYLRVGFNS